jgi:membrane protein
VDRLRAELRWTAQAAWRGLVELVNSNDLTHAASIAYYALLSLFPFLLLIISLLGSITASEDQRLAVLTFVFRYFPTRLDFVTSQLDAFRQTRIQVGVAGSLALIWSSLGVFGAITSAVNEAWGVEKQRSFLKHRMVSFLMLVAAGLVMIVGLLLVTAIQFAEASWFGVMLLRFEWLRAVQTWTFQYAATIILIFGVGLVFYFIPNAKTRFRDVWVGAALTGVLWRLAFDGFSWYIARNSRLAFIQGSIAAVVVFLLWIYVSSVILMYGVEFTAAYARLRRHRSEQMPAAPTPRV